MKYIDAEKLEAEIKRLQQLNEAYKKDWRWKWKWFSRTITGRLETLEGIKCFLDKMEVKNVELEAEGKYDCDDLASWISFKSWMLPSTEVGKTIKVLLIKSLR